MGTKCLIHIIAGISLFLLSGCDNDPKEHITSRLSATYDANSNELYRKAIFELTEWIEKESVVHDSGHYYIFNNDVFKDLYLNPSYHFKYGVRYILDSQANSQVKQLIVRTLQCLPLAEYLELGKNIIELDDLDLSTTYLSPGPEYGFIIDEHYKNSDVKTLLTEFQVKQPELVGTIELIRTGTNINRYRELRKFGEKLPVLECL